MIVFQVVFCVLAMVGLVTAFNWAGRRIDAAVMGHRIREREDIIRREVTDLDAAFIALTQGDFDD